jgi:hypothetical protein
LKSSLEKNLQVLKEGLIKKRDSNGNWNKLLCFLLSNNELRIYDNEHVAFAEIQQTPSEVLNIDTVTAVANVPEVEDPKGVHKNCLRVHATSSNEEIVHLFSFDTHEMQENWASLLQDLKPK